MARTKTVAATSSPAASASTTPRKFASGRRRLVCAGLSLFAVGALLAIGVTPGCGGSPPRRLIVSGASTWGPILSKLEADFAARAPGVQLQVELGGTTRGLRECLEGRNDLGAAARALTPEEAGSFQHYSFALDGVAVILHRDNDLANITTAQLRDIWTGTAKDWSDLGGTPGPIFVVGKEDGHATLEVFADHIGVPKGQHKVSARAGDNTAVLQTVGASPNAIGYVSLGEAMQTIAQFQVRLVPLDGVRPSIEAVESGAWPMTRPLSLVSNGAPGSEAKALLDLLASERGEEVLRACGFVPTRRRGGR